MYDILHSSRYPVPDVPVLPNICGSTCINVPNNSTWVVLGDSIVDAKWYSNYFESYFHLRYPSMTFHFRGEGRGGSTIPEVTTSDRYGRRVFAWEPDFVSSMFGHNGSFTAAQFKSQFQDLNNNYIIAKSGAIPVMFGPHPKYTSDGKPILGDYSNAIIDLGIADGLVYSDIWHYLKPIFSGNLANPVIDMHWINDVHPGPIGHLAIAYALLLTIQATGVVSSATINTSPLQVSQVTNATITGLTTNGNNGIDFNRLDTRLPMAFDDSARDIFIIMPQIYDMNQYMLTVTGLASGNYEVYIDSVLSATVTAAALAAGWNMTSMTAGPIHDQLIEVLGRIRDKEGVDRSTLADIMPRVGIARYQSNADNGYNNLGYREQDLIDYLNSLGTLAAVNALDVSIKSAAQPINRAFSLRKV